MFLHRIHLDPRCREARRDLSDPYELHCTLCRAFSQVDGTCPQGEFLWRLEPETDQAGCPLILVQSHSMPVWTAIGVKGWLAAADPAVDLRQRLDLDSLKEGRRYRFRLRANPSVSRDGKRLGLLRRDDQERWLERKGQRHGFVVQRLAPFDLSECSEERVDVRISHEQMLRGTQRSGNSIRIYSVLYDGMLSVADPVGFRNVLEIGIGHGKSMGLGLLSVVPIR